MANGDDAFKSLLGRFGYGKGPAGRAMDAAPAEHGAEDDEAEEVLPLAVEPDLLLDAPLQHFPDSGFGISLDSVREAVSAAGQPEAPAIAPAEAAEERAPFAPLRMEELLAPLEPVPSSPPPARRAASLSEERLALLHRVAQEARGEGVHSSEEFDMGYREPLVDAVRQPVALAQEHEVSEALPVPSWARIAAERGLLGHEAGQVFDSLDALGLVNDDRYAEQAAAYWPVEAQPQAFADLAAIALTARSELPAATRNGDGLGRHGYFYLKGAAYGVPALIVADGSSREARGRVAEICGELDQAGKRWRVVLLTSYSYRWALRRFLWPEIVAAGDVGYAMAVADAARVYAAPAADGRRLLLLETAQGMEAVAMMDAGEAAQWLGALGAEPDPADAGIWCAAGKVGGERGKAAALAAFGLDDKMVVNRLVKELSRPGAIVFVAGEMAEAMAAALMAEAWSQGVAGAAAGSAAASGLPSVWLNPDAQKLRAHHGPALAVFPGRNSTAESALMLLLGEQPGWAKGRVSMGVNTVRLPGLCPICALSVDADLAARELTEVVSNFRSADFGNVKTRNLREPCCGSGYAGEVWLSEVWDGKLCQRDFGVSMLADLVDKGLRPDQRISSLLFQAIQAGRVDYRSAGSL
ncbi:hypothetical protein [Chromobacterium subtsugae]|uniref:hypothetical protein n=1 Tax=Chromobacterium subtsugae TaxID=251747 RepID=UPI0006416316|nr:hypothetical protein [Chromobacterium subtsugae]OBU85742.1 hypothetical protein MY55_14185 [Chromobacterium subtsugae]